MFVKRFVWYYHEMVVQDVELLQKMIHAVNKPMTSDCSFKDIHSQKHKQCPSLHAHVHCIVCMHRVVACIQLSNN